MTTEAEARQQKRHVLYRAVIEPHDGELAFTIAPLDAPGWADPADARDAARDFANDHNLGNRTNRLEWAPFTLTLAGEWQATT